MERPPSSDLVSLLRQTLKRLENDEKLSSSDPALLELKRSILRALSELVQRQKPTD